MRTLPIENPMAEYTPSVTLMTRGGENITAWSTALWFSCGMFGYRTPVNEVRFEFEVTFVAFVIFVVLFVVTIEYEFVVVIFWVALQAVFPE